MVGNLSFLSQQTVPPNFRMTIADLVANWCAQVDTRILFLLFCLLTFEVYFGFVRPRLKEWFVVASQKWDLLRFCLKYFDGFLETAALFSVVLMLGVFAAQRKLTAPFIVWGFLLFVLAVGVQLLPGKVHE